MKTNFALLFLLSCLKSIPHDINHWIVPAISLILKIEIISFINQWRVYWLARVCVPTHSAPKASKLSGFRG